MGKLLLSGNTADCWFVVEEKGIPAHKIVLSSFSPVFKTMFDSNCNEAKTGKIPIEDFSLDSMGIICSLIYEEFDEEKFYIHLDDIYRFIDKYDMGELLKWITAILLKKLNFQNICRTASSACSYQDKSKEIMELYEKCLQLLVNNYQFISKMKNYKDINPEVVKDVMGMIQIPG
ncbi:hypothetical protein FO519_006915 [Halicephalobus sp. NKZ332]|nr:hypothetical protein FO519_006915 [Halicephalobus sp. NKZ332]